MSVMRVPTASAQRMKLLVMVVTTNYSLRPPSLMVNDSQRAACMSLMAISVWSIISTRCHTVHMQCGSNGGQRHVLTDKPCSAATS
ncbi:Uncharacterised protein [Escherichia coli]|uniref:Uncharacterized protein n=1 Tax=Escherichia coli TaxID=562 RepID=A0A376U6N4_ECOLX|nr:Uncharacterised protein [Escherichia coli]